jgi:ubiquinone/menaquinone biosynthesis C-methylase UbiE
VKAEPKRPVLLDELSIQRAYYRRTAGVYDASHLLEQDLEHRFALTILDSIIEHFSISSLLDIGAGTGRVARHLMGRHTNLRVVSIEPVRELREIGYSNGLSRAELIEGDVNQLEFSAGAFDLVCEFGVLHHLRHPAIAVAQMLRVARTGIFVSDCNNFGQGSGVTRAIKQLLNALKLWRAADLIKTRGKGFTLSEGDGLAYSYSVFDNYRQIARECRTYLFNTQPAGINPYRSAGHIALLGIKRSERLTPE